MLLNYTVLSVTSYVEQKVGYYYREIFASISTSSVQRQMHTVILLHYLTII